MRENRISDLVDTAGVRRTRIETGHTRRLAGIFGDVTVTRLVYRGPRAANLHPADAALNLPAEMHSHGLRRLVAIESSRGSFDGAVQAVERATGQALGKRQVEDLAARAGSTSMPSTSKGRRAPSGDTRDRARSAPPVPFP